MSLYDLVLFDLDGTLIDSLPDIAAALNGALAEEGLPGARESEVRQMVGDGLTELVRRALGPAHRHRVEAVERGYRARFAENMGRTCLYPGVAEGLRAAPAVQKAIVTNKLGAQARGLVNALGVAPCFFAVLGPDDAGAHKPDPRGLDLLRKRVGVEARRTLYVGDSLVDAATARAAGVDLCLVTYGYGDPAALAQAPARFFADRFEEVVRIYAGPKA